MGFQPASRPRPLACALLLGRTPRDTRDQTMDASPVSSVTATAPSSNTSTSPSGARVLLVEHDARLRESIRTQLLRDRFVCEAVADAALRCAQVQVFDLVVMDLGAPNVASRRICRTLRGETVNRRVPVVMIA